MESAPQERLLAVGIEPKTVENILKNKKVTESFMEVLTMGEVTTAPKEKGALLYALATKLKPVHMPYKAEIVKMVVQDKWTRMPQIDAGLDFILEGTRSQGSEFKID